MQARANRLLCPVTQFVYVRIMTVTIYHNPKCGTSRTVLELLRAQNIAPIIIEYLKTPLGKAELKALIARLGVTAKDILRWKERDVVAETGVTESSSEAALIDAMAAHPILLNRPIVITPKGAKLCRPSETVK